MSREACAELGGQAVECVDERVDVARLDDDLPLVLTLDEVLRVLRISERTWYRAKASGFPIVPEIAHLPGRYSRARVLAAIDDVEAYRAVAQRKRRRAAVALLHPQTVRRRTA